MSTNQAPPPTENSEIERAKTMFVITQASPSSQPEFNYDHYFKVRDREAAEVKLRRERQFEMLKWTSAFLLGAIAAIPNVVSSLSVGCWEMPIRFGIAAIVALTCFSAARRIRHDAKIAHFRAKVCHAMDEGVGYQFDDRMLKNGGLTYGQANVFCWFLFLLGMFVCFELFTIPVKQPSSGKAAKQAQRAKSVSQQTTPTTGNGKTKIPDAKDDMPVSKGTTQ